MKGESKCALNPVFGRWRSQLLYACAAVGLAVMLLALLSGGADAQNAARIARGRYLVKLGGCNDCHTDGFTESNAKVPERDWLEGSALGWHGPWGTTYPVNLRLLVGSMSEGQWLEYLRTMQPKPPMPWWALRWMTPQDQRAVYVYIRHLGPTGKKAPADLPPGVSPLPPFVSFPMPPALAKTAR
ncbi:MAG: hypothetical protein ACREFK_09335 [Stellaceae bacterium]